MFQYRSDRRTPSAESVTRTIRLDSDLNQQLDRLSREGNVSVNFLIVQALRKYTEWEIYAEKLGMISLGKNALEKLFNSLSEKEARALGRDNGNDGGTDIITFIFKKFDYETFVKMAELFGERYGRFYTFEKSSEGESDTLIFKHDKGLNVSAYIAESMNTTLSSLVAKTEVLESENQVTIKVWR